MRRMLFSITALACCGLGFIAGRTMQLSSNPVAARNHVPDVVLASLLTQPEEMDEATLAMIAAGMPGEHHEALNPLIGTFKGYVRIKMAPDAEAFQMPGEVTREWILDGRYVKETVTSEFEGQPFHGMGIIGYDNLDGLYQAVWIDSASTTIMTESGTYEAAKKTFHFSGTHRDPMSGKLIMSQSSVDLSNPDRQVMHGTVPGPDGTPYENFYGVFERVQ